MKIKKMGYIVVSGELWGEFCSEVERIDKKATIDYSTVRDLDIDKLCLFESKFISRSDRSDAVSLCDAIEINRSR